MTGDLVALTPRIEFRGVSKHYGAVAALESVSFSVAPGEIVGLIGHNGAGKSTLMNIATGATTPTAGSIAVDGSEIPAHATARDFSEVGVSIIRQEPTLIGTLSVLDNLWLNQPRPRQATDQRARATAALERVGASHLALARPVMTLATGERQLVDIARGLLNRETRVLMLDEPTAALGPVETEALHSLIDELAAQGVSVIYISHRLPDILDVCTRAVVLRDGAVVLDEPMAALTAVELTNALAPGIKFDEIPLNPPASTARLEVLEPGRLAFAPGHVVGLFGMAHGEQFALLEQLFGRRGGLVAKLDGSPYAPKSSADAVSRKIHLVPADRDEEGLLVGMSAEDNVYLPWPRWLRGGRRRAGALYRSIREDLHISGPSGNAPIAMFSGGNRQKHLLARWVFPVRPEVLLLAQPTQGVDVGAKTDIRRAVWDVAAQGTTVLVASAEADEIASICNDAYVLNAGRITQVSRGEDADFETELLETLLTM